MNILKTLHSHLILFLYHDKDSLLRDIIWSSMKNNPYYKGAELWDNLAMSTIECDKIFLLTGGSQKRDWNLLEYVNI